MTAPNAPSTYPVPVENPYAVGIPPEVNYYMHAAGTNATVSVRNAQGLIALASQAFHLGEAQVAFQAAHARFIAAAEKINVLLNQAQLNLSDARTTYVAQDAIAASSFTG